jgi:hypothetical protein
MPTKILAFVALFLTSVCALGQTNEFELPKGVPSPTGVDGKYTKYLMFTTKAYQTEAFRLVLQEANKVAAELSLPESLPIQETNVEQIYISPFGIGWAKKRIGSISTSNYVYYISRGNKFSYLEKTHQEIFCQQIQKLYNYPISEINTNEAYEMATQWLAKASMDVESLNRDYPVVVQLNRDYVHAPNGKFVPVYDIFWPRKGLNGSVASVRLFVPTKTLMQLRVEEPKYILRQPLVFTNLEELLSQTNPAIFTQSNAKAKLQSLPYRTPAKLSSQIKNANRIDITYRFAEQFKQFQGFVFSVPAQRVSEIIQAISQSKQYENTTPSNSMWEWELHFYNGKNNLAVVDFQGSVFLADGEYSDDSRVLDKLQQDVLKKANEESGN